MFENDYIMRVIREMVRTLLKLICQIDMEKTEDLQVDQETAMELDRLKGLVDEGKINQAENELLEQAEAMNPKGLSLALLFYEYLNQKDAEFLKAHDFSREEISDGIKSIVKSYGYGSTLAAVAQEEIE